MAKNLYIFTDEDLITEHDEELQENFINEYYGDRSFITMEDSALLIDEQEETLFIQEYVDN